MLNLFHNNIFMDISLFLKVPCSHNSMNQITGLDGASNGFDGLDSSYCFCFITLFLLNI